MKLEKAQNLANSILRDEYPWKSISEFNGDWSLFSENVVKSAFLARLRTPEQTSEMTLVIMSDSNLGNIIELVETLIGTMYWSSDYWKFTKDVLKFAPDDVLKGPVHNYFVEWLSSEKGAIYYYDLLRSHELMKADHSLIEAIIDNQECLKSDFIESSTPVDDIRIIADVPEIIHNQEFWSVILYWLENSSDLSDNLIALKKLPQLSENNLFWNRVYSLLIDIDAIYSNLADAFNLEWFLYRKYSPYKDIESARVALMESIESRGWSLMRMSLLSQLSEADWQLNDKEITKHEAQDFRNRFFQLFGLEEIKPFTGTLKEILLSISWEGSYESLRKQFHYNITR